MTMPSIWRIWSDPSALTDGSGAGDGVWTALPIGDRVGAGVGSDGPNDGKDVGADAGAGEVAPKSAAAKNVAKTMAFLLKSTKRTSFSFQRTSAHGARHSHLHPQRR